MLFWCCCPVLPFLCVVGCCVALYAVAMLFWYAVVGRWRCPVVCLLSVCRWCMLWYGFIMSTTLPCTLCQPPDDPDGISTDFHRIFATRTRDSKNHRSGQKIHQDLLQKSVFLNTHICVRESPKIFPEMTVFLIDMTHT